MDPQTKALILEWLQQVGDAVKTGAAFVAEQTPLVIQEKITFARAEYTAWMLLCVILLVYVAVAATRATTLANRIDKTDSSGDLMQCVIFVLSGIASLIISLTILNTTTSTFFKVWFAPRVYILEWIMSGLK